MQDRECYLLAMLYNNLKGDNALTKVQQAYVIATLKQTIFEMSQSQADKVRYKFKIA